MSRLVPRPHPCCLPPAAGLLQSPGRGQPERGFSQGWALSLGRWGRSPQVSPRLLAGRSVSPAKAPSFWKHWKDPFQSPAGQDPPHLGVELPPHRPGRGASVSRTTPRAWA